MSIYIYIYMKPLTHFLFVELYTRISLIPSAGSCWQRRRIYICLFIWIYIYLYIHTWSPRITNDTRQRDLQDKQDKHPLGALSPCAGAGPPLWVNPTFDSHLPCGKRWRLTRFYFIWTLQSDFPDRERGRMLLASMPLLLFHFIYIYIHLNIYIYICFYI